MSLSRACRYIGISRQAIYQAEQRDTHRQQALAPVRDWVLAYRRTMPRIGTRKLYHLLQPRLQQHGIKLGRDGLFSYLRQEQLLVRQRRSYTKTTDSRHWMRCYPNRLKETSAPSPESIVVSDITYVESRQGVHYLSLVTDSYSRKVVGYQLSHDMKTPQVIQALKMAARKRQHRRPLIHHSDRGSQYCSRLYQQALKRYHMIPSMTDGYDCYQNALAERVNGILKQEFLIERCNTFEELSPLIDESIFTYNHLRPHLSLGMKTPEQVHNQRDPL